MILYFSATGNSEYIAHRISDATGDTEIASINDYLRQNKPLEFTSDKPYVIVAPVYISTIPQVIRTKLKYASFFGNKKVYFVMTCAGSTSASDYFARKICENKGWEYMGTVHVSMPQDYLMFFKVKSDEENAGKVEAADKKLPALAEKIKSEKPFEGSKAGLSHILFIKPTEVMYRWLIKPQKFYATDKCISCGLCENVCPLNNVHSVDGKPQWGPSCIHCTACINRCPKEAIEYGKSTQGKRRYRFDK